VALQQLYQQEGQLSVQPLRHPRMLQLLLSGAWLDILGKMVVNIVLP
jgi:hypothetical protein